MAEVLHRDDTLKFSVYRLSEMPLGVKMSGATVLANWQSDGAHYFRSLGRRYFESFTRADLSHREADACVAVLDEHADLILAARFAIGMRVVLSAVGRSVYGHSLPPGTVTSLKPVTAGTVLVDVLLEGSARPSAFGVRMWDPASQPEPEPSKPSYPCAPDATDAVAYHEFHTRYLGARHGEQSVYYASNRANPNVLRAYERWAAHLRFLCAQSAVADHARQTSLGWDPYGDDA